MRAICVREPGGTDVLEMREVADPVPGPFEIRVAVKAVGLNRADLLQRRGLYPPPPDVAPDILGLEFAGEIEALGAQATRFKKGERVMGVVGGGAYAEKLLIHEGAAMHVPGSLDFPRAAAVPEAFLTAFDALLLQALLQPGEHLLVHAVASGVGTAALQLGKLVGARVIGTSRSKEKLSRCAALGLDHGLLVDQPRFAAKVRDATGGHGADVVLDLVGGAYLEENVLAMAPRGRQIVIGLLAGTSGKLALDVLLSRRLTIRGTVLRSRSIEEKIGLVQAFERQVLPHFETGVLKPVVEEVLPIADCRRAHERLEGNDTFGKLVLAW